MARINNPRKILLINFTPAKVAGFQELLYSLKIIVRQYIARDEQW